MPNWGKTTRLQAYVAGVLMGLSLMTLSTTFHASGLNGPEGLSLLGESPATPVEAREATSLPAVTSNASVVPLKAAQNALMVDATIINKTTGQRVTGTFIVDTGATYTSISEEMAEALGVKSNGDAVRITTANGRIEVPRVSLDQIVVNGVEAHDVQATVIQLRPGTHFSGLLGLSFIRQFRVTIDPSAGQLVFEPNL
ncbi:MAG: TIGR02281 family clan AA aspartic protease [Candidatus Melainabacteria bacterium]